MLAHSRVKEERLVLLLKGMSVEGIEVWAGEKGEEASEVKTSD